MAATAESSSLAGRQLFVGNLPFSVAWQDVKDLFRTAGTVLRADVVSNASGRSRGFGTVLFETAEEAQNAIDQFNGYDWHGRKIEVREDKNVREDGAAPQREQYVNPVDPSSIQSRSLYVGNLPWSCGWGDLKDLFRTAGTVLRADIPSDYHGRSRGFGTVVMASVEDARKAVENFNGYEWHGRKIEVREDRSEYQHRSNERPAGRQLYVGNIPYTFQWQDLKDIFRPCGTVVRADVTLDQSGRSKGFGTVVMSTVEEAQKAIQTLNGTQVQGRNIEVREDKYSGEQEAGTSVFVGNLPFSTSWQNLKDLFRPFGLNPTHADILSDASGRSKGCGIVKFATKEEAEKAVKEVNETNVLGRQIHVRLDKWA